MVVAATRRRLTHHWLRHRKARIDVADLEPRVDGRRQDDVVRLQVPRLQRQLLRARGGRERGGRGRVAGAARARQTAETAQ